MRFDRSLMTMSPWYDWSPDALLVLGAVLGRDAVSDGPRRQVLSLAGAGTLAMALTAAIGFDVVAWLADTFREDTLMSRASVDGPLTMVPRLALESAVLAACLAHARGRSWGVLAIGVLTPSLAVLLAISGQLPVMGGGCLAWGHPLWEIGVGGVGPLEVAFGLAVVPWIGPIARALRSRR